MKYVYSVIRFVPDPARGEFVNVGVLVGSDEASDWKLRVIDNPRRARALDDKNVLPGLWHLTNEIDRRIDQYEAYLDSPTDSPPVDLSERWLERMWQESQNIVQFSAPAPIAALTADEAVDILFHELIIDPESRRFPFQKKPVAIAALRRAYAVEGVRHGARVAEGALVRGTIHHERFDFAVAGIRAVQLAQAWSFQIPNQEQLAENIKAWAWTVQDIRKSGGALQLGHDAVVSVPRDVDVEVVYIPPREGTSRALMDEAFSAFREVEARPVNIAEATEVGRRARGLLSAAS